MIYDPGLPLSRKPYIIHCRDCDTPRVDDEIFWHGRCPSCRKARGASHRQQMGAKLLAKAKDAGTVLRDGQTFTVVTLPPKRRGGNR